MPRSGKKEKRSTTPRSVSEELLLEAGQQTTFPTAWIQVILNLTPPVFRYGGQKELSIEYLWKILRRNEEGSNHC